MKTVKELMGLVEAKAKKMKGADPCWDNYEMVGTKKKNGKEVPNCVPKTEEVVAEGSDYTPPKLGTVKANLMNTQKPTVQVQVFKHNTLRGDSYWVTKEVKTFKTMDQAQTYADRINKKDVAEEVEQVDELNKDTVYSYKKKSEKEEDEAHEKLEKEMKSGNARAANKTGKKIMNRLAGQERAEKRLNNEEVEQVDELSVTTLGSYVNKSFNDITVKNKLANKHMAIASMHNKSNKPDAENKSIQNAMVLNALAKQRAAKAQKALGKVSGVTEGMVGDWTSLKNKSGKTIHIKSNTNSPTRHTFDVHLDKNNPPIEKGRLNKRNIKLRHDAGEFDKHFNQGVAEDLKMLPRQGNETNAERQKRLSAELEHQYKTKTGQFADYNDNRYPSLSQYNAHGDDEYQAKKLKKQKHVKEAGDPELMGGTMSKPTASGNNPKLAGKFVKAFRKAGVDAKIKCTTINNISACEDVNVAFTEAVKKDEATSTKDVKKGEKLSGKQEPIKINPPLPQR